MDKPKRELVIVNWVDPSSCRGWQKISDLEESGPMVCWSVGWILRKNKEILILVSHIAGEIDDKCETIGTGDMAIPRKSVISICKL